MVTNQVAGGPSATSEIARGSAPPPRCRQDARAAGLSAPRTMSEAVSTGCSPSIE
jgi:hypothetical protein